MVTKGLTIMTAYRICTRCVMDTSDPEISFDVHGVCNHCRKAEKLFYNSPLCFDNTKKSRMLSEFVEKIKKRGAGKKYDCIIGLSGGVDSSYVAVEVKRLGLRPLAVHLDNGWNSELAVQNIENICTKLDIDLFTYVIDWEEFRDLQLSFLKASTPDSEIPTDHAIFSTMYNVAYKYGVKYIISGTNINSESILPTAWSQGHMDWRYIKAVQKKFGLKKLKTFPRRNWLRIMFDAFTIKWVSILDYINYDKETARKVIEKEVGWRNYGRKHGESNYTRIFQEYILPKKFGYDKRRAHLSSLIVAGQISRFDAVKQLEEPLYPSSEKEAQDIAYLINKLGISKSDFEVIMSRLPMRMEEYPNSTYSWYNKLIWKVIRRLKKK